MLIGQSSPSFIRPFRAAIVRYLSDGQFTQLGLSSLCALWNDRQQHDLNLPLEIQGEIGVASSPDSASTATGVVAARGFSSNSIFASWKSNLMSLPSRA